MTTECSEQVGQICERMRAVNAELDACRAEVIDLRERLRITAQILVETIGASGPANADDLARIAAAEVARLREVSKEYIHALAVIRAENHRYRADLLELQDENERLVSTVSAIRKLVMPESGQLSDDSGPIAGDGK